MSQNLLINFGLHIPQGLNVPQIVILVYFIKNIVCLILNISRVGLRIHQLTHFCGYVITISDCRLFVFVMRYVLNISATRLCTHCDSDYIPSLSVATDLGL